MIYRGYALFKRLNGKIIEIKREPNFRGNLSGTSEQKSIILNQNDSLDEKVKTVIHELLHLGYEYGTLSWEIIPGLPIPTDLKISKREAVKIVGRFERIVNRETERVFQCQPVLVNYLRYLIEKSFAEYIKSRISRVLKKPTYLALPNL